MKKNQSKSVKFFNTAIQKLLLRLCCVVFLLMINYTVIFGQTFPGLRLRGTLSSFNPSVGAQSSIYTYQPEKFTPSIPLTTFLQGAFNTGLLRHKNVTATWAAVLNANALNQPYHVAAFGYTGTESVNPGFFTSTAATTDILDWVLVEIRSDVNPATVVTRKACFIREDGLIVDLDGVSNPSFRALATGSYHVVIRHRNHLAIRTATPISWDASLCVPAPASHNFSTAQTQAYQNPAITTNPAMVDIGGVFSMMGGNANGFGTAGNTTIRVSGGTNPLINDYIYLFTTVLGGNINFNLNNTYNYADLNMDGTVRANGGTNPAVNDYIFLITTALGGDINKVLTQHQ